jgi:hypothetical protein
MLTLIRYLFRGARLKQRLPLLPTRASSQECRYAVDPARQVDLNLLIRSGVAKTQADAMRLLVQYPGAKITDVIAAARHERRHRGRLSMAWHRFTRLW